ncbi:cardioacceleratory peptide receptor-like [Mya arenaria]|uniref:cardioacceleratory peptide receptor-like n=1 Tax=Mya arenaria TaxID=6604 RepID=UPI0022E63D18|nr:cardioacceleratory peptide receptor-like [Mya arenaria]
MDLEMCNDLQCENGSVDLNMRYNDTQYDENYTYGYYYIVDQNVEFWQVPQLVVLNVLFLMIVLGNTCVLVAIYMSEKGIKTRMNYLMMHLAVADLTVGLFHLTADIVERWLVVWYGGAALCKIIKFLQVLVVYSSTFMIVALSIDRADAIARPMKFTRKATTVRALVIGAWISSAIFSVPAFLFFDTMPLNGEYYCLMTLQNRWQWQLYITLVALTALIIPALIIVSCYTIIMYAIWETGRGLNALQSAHSSANRSPMPGNNKGIIPQAQIKTVKMTLIIVIMFVLCWCPYFVYNLKDVYSEIVNNSKTYHALTSLIQSLAPLNSAANPIIYGVFGTGICTHLRRLPCCMNLHSWCCGCDCYARRTLLRNSTNNLTNVENTGGDGTSATCLIHRPNFSGIKPGFRRESRLQEKLNRKNILVACTRSNGNKHMPESIELMDSNKSLYQQNTPAKRPFNRRPSGLPLANRKMTHGGIILLESYGKRVQKTDINNDMAETNNLLNEGDEKKVKSQPSNLIQRTLNV